MVSASICMCVLPLKFQHLEKLPISLKREECQIFLATPVPQHFGASRYRGPSRRARAYARQLHVATCRDAQIHSPQMPNHVLQTTCK